MKQICTLLLGISFVLSALYAEEPNTLLADLKFVGVLSSTARVDVALKFPDGKSAWITVGGAPYQGVRAAKFSAVDSVLTVMADDAARSLHLQGPRILGSHATSNEEDELLRLAALPPLTFTGRNRTTGTMLKEIFQQSGLKTDLDPAAFPNTLSFHVKEMSAFEFLALVAHEQKIEITVENGIWHACSASTPCTRAYSLDSPQKDAVREMGKQLGFSVEIGADGVSRISATAEQHRFVSDLILATSR